MLSRRTHQESNVNNWMRDCRIVKHKRWIYEVFGYRRSAQPTCGTHTHYNKVGRSFCEAIIFDGIVKSR